MYAVIRRFEGVDPTSVPEIVRSVNESLLPVMSELPGFVAYYALDAGGGVIASITIVQDRAAADEVARVFADPTRQNTPRGLLPAPQVTMGEIVTHQLGATPGSRS